MTTMHEVLPALGPTGGIGQRNQMQSYQHSRGSNQRNQKWYRPPRISQHVLRKVLTKRLRAEEPKLDNMEISPCLDQLHPMARIRAEYYQHKFYFELL